MSQENSTVKVAIAGGVIVLALVGGFLGWRATNGGLSAEDTAKLSKPPTATGANNVNLLNPPGGSAAPRGLPSQGGATAPGGVNLLNPQGR